MAIDPACVECGELFGEIREALAPLGIRLRAGSFDVPYDVALVVPGIDFPDGASFLQNLIGGDIPADWLPPGALDDVRALEVLSGDERVTATAALAERLTRDVVPAVAYGRPMTSAFFSPRLGCRSFPPFGFGVDLASLCLSDTGDVTTG
jgi:hypothetical protein